MTAYFVSWVLAHAPARRWLVPPQRHRAVPWSGAEVIVGLLFVLLFWPAFADEMLTRMSFFTWLYGPVSDEFLAVRRKLWIGFLTFPVSVLAIPLLFRFSSGTRPYQLGLTTH